MNFLTRITRNLFQPPRTEAYPFGEAETPKAYRGRVAIDEETCVGCSTCAQVCVNDAIRLVEEPEGICLTIWHSKCCFCALCEYYCPTEAMFLTNDWDLNHPNSDKYLMQDSIIAKYRICVDCGAKLMVPVGNAATAFMVGKDRLDQIGRPRCEACRRSTKAAEIIGAAR
ncbi:MAG: 4Fe-4S binding protein [Candidatus Thiodiazotropha sp.]